MPISALLVGLEVRENNMITEIDHVQISAPPGSESSARDFFGRLLRLQEVEKPEALRARGGCWFQVGSRQLHVGIDDNFRPATKAHPAFAVTDLEALCKHLEGAGITCVWDHSIEGVRRFFAQDPWGNRVEFTEPA